MNKLSLWFAALAIAAAGAGCKTVKPAQGQQTPTKAQSTLPADIKNISNILYGEWSVANVNGQAVVGDDRPYVTFDTVATNSFLKKFYAYNGCNVINGMVAVNTDGSMKKAGDYMATMKYCPEATYEIGVTMVLENIARFKIEKIGNDYLLYLTATNPQQNMILRKSDISFVNGAWAVTRIGDKVIDESKGIEVVIDIPEKKIHGNAGCNVVNGEIVINPDVQHAIQFVNLATTRMTCPDIALEQEFLKALGEVTTVNQDHSVNNIVMKNASGTTLLELKRIELQSSVAQD